MKRIAAAWVGLLFAIALLAPLIANDVPIVARIDGALRFPAFASYTGQAAIGPYRDRIETWNEWWAALPTDSDDWAVMPPWPYGPLMDRAIERRNEPPSLEHPFGIDDVGRDLLSRILWGTQTAFYIAAGTVLLSALIGVPLGALAGYHGGWIDAVISLLIEIFLCFPGLFAVLIAAALFGNSPLAVMIILGGVFWTTFARLVRGEVLGLREREFVLAARGLGVSSWRILSHHILPNAAGPIRVNAAFLFAGAIVIEATLAFLGLGGNESWGTILARSKEPALHGVWHVWVFPALAVVSTVWAFHALADHRVPRRLG